MSQLVICRTCGKKIYNLKAKNIFDPEDKEILKKIHILTGIYFTADQHMPNQICAGCHLDINHSICFRERCIKTNKLLLDRKRKDTTILDPWNSTKRLLPTSKIESKKLLQLEIVSDSATEHHTLNEQKSKRIRNQLKLKRPPTPETNDSCEENPQSQCPNVAKRKRKRTAPKVMQSTEWDNAVLNESIKKPRRAVRQSEVSKTYVCEQCGRSFADSSNLKVHILRHTGVKDFACMECGLKYFTRHLLHLHIRVRHLGEKPYACKYCDQRFFTSTSRCRHERTCGKRKNRLKSKNLFAEDNEILQKIEVLTGLWLTDERSIPDQICAYCLLDLDHAIEFRERCIKINDFLLVGNRNEIQSNPQAVLNPLEINSKYTDDDPLANDGTHIMLEDGEFGSAEIESEFTHNLPYKIVPASNASHTIPEISISAHNQTKSHNLKIDRETSKPICSSKTAPNPFSHKRRRHLQSQFYEPTEDEQLADSKSTDHAGLADKCLSVSVSSSSKAVRKLRSLFCDQCGRHFNDKANLNRHLLRHLGEKKFECQQCDHKDYTQHLINLHIRIQHQGEKPYSCKYCGKRFANTMARLRHQRSHVECLEPQIDVPAVTCSFCNKTFTKKSSLDKHAVVHTGEQPFCCEICNIYFNRKSSLQTHYRSKAHIIKTTFKLDTNDNDSN